MCRVTNKKSPTIPETLQKSPTIPEHGYANMCMGMTVVGY